MRSLLALPFLLAVTAAHAQDSGQDTGALLKQKAQALADAIAPGHMKVWDAILDTHFVMTDENGVVSDRAESLRQIVPLPKGAGGHINVIDWKMADLEKDIAVSTYVDDEFEDYHGQHIHAQYRITATWVRRGDGWKLLAMQLLATRQDPPAVRLPAKLLDDYVGRYSGGPGLDFTIRRKGDGLVGERPGHPPVTLKAELADVLFVPGQPRSRDIFRRNPQGRIIGFVSRREERDVVYRRVG